jgi:hypothetical protein
MRAKLFAFFVGLTFALATAPVHADGIKATVYTSPQCKCCGIYAKYLRENDFEVTIQNIPDVIPVKKYHRIDDRLWSCHTSVIDGYLIEGHVPIEALDRLLAEKPAIRGIGLPGMPVGSPGMPGRKSQPFEIMTITDSEPTVYMTL